MANYDSSPKGLENLGSVFTEGIDYFNTNFPSSPTLEKDNFFFNSNHSEIAIQSMEDRFKNSNTFGEFSTNNAFGETNFPYVQSEFQPSKTSWKNLYNENHTIKSDIGYHYNTNVNRSRLDIRNLNPDGGSVIGGISLRRYSDISGKEPYIVSDIPQTLNTSGGRQLNFGSREFPIQRATTDLERISKFLTSPAGIMFIGKQEALGSLSMTEIETQNQLVSGRTFKAFYNPLSTLMSVGPTNRFLGQGPNVIVDRLFPNTLETLFGASEYGMDAIKERNNSQSNQSIWNVFNEGLQTQQEDGFTDPRGQIETFFDSLLSGTNVNLTSNLGRKTSGIAFGDPHTLMPLDESDYNTSVSEKPQNLEEAFPTMKDKIEGTDSKTYGMPFYFKDLRDGKYIIFRAYVDGITENIQPTWTPTNYVGRSEPVYVYSRGERDISFNLKLFAQTPAELQMIYRKMNRLTSLCYPEYAEDENLENKTRMKPPITKFRLGELFGNARNELTGFIKSLTYSVPDEGVWETEYGKRVPKYITAAINYQVIHATVPSLNMLEERGFYGYDGEKQPGVANLS